mmetsp:Transcript_36185/g.65663  ORF Transcript_36185/g.65663 Transcript_36185/m.65663 type:complete len:298 (-) Transcript_36185:79-972(-)
MAAASQFGDVIRQVLLTQEGRRYIEANFTPQEIGASAADARSWWVYYDSKELVLARQSAWLRECGDEWQMVCSSAPSTGLLSNAAASGSRLRQAAGARTLKSRTLSTEKDILSCLGLKGQPAESSSGKGGLRRTLDMGGLRPIARIRTELKSFVAELPSSGGRQVAIDLQDMHFDTKHAEPATISVLLEKHGNEIRQKALRACCADLRVAFPERRGASMTADGEQVDQFLKRHQLDYQGGGSYPSSSFMHAYLRLCRPAQLHSLTEAGITLDTQDIYKDGRGVPTLLPDNEEEVYDI